MWGYNLKIIVECVTRLIIRRLENVKQMVREDSGIVQYFIMKETMIMSLSAERGWGTTYYHDLDDDQPTSAKYIDIDHDHDKSHLLHLTEKKSLTEDDRSQFKHHHDYSGFLQTKSPVRLRPHKSLLPQIMHRKIKTVKSQIVVYFFNTNRRIVFTRSQLKQHFKEDHKKGLRIQDFIPFIVRQYCKLFLYFQPLQVNHEYFQLKIANLKNREDQLLDPFPHDEQVAWLFECGSLVLTRKKKSTERILAWQEKYEDQKQVLEIIIPFQRELLQKIDKNKTINLLKEKIMTYSQLSNIVIVTYHDFKVCEGKKKIGQIIEMDRILEVYREKVNTFEDIPEDSPKQTKQDFSTSNCNLINQQFEVNASFYWGRQYLHIVGTKIIEKHEGGVVGYLLSDQRRVERSVYTLVGLGCCQKYIKMEFITKDGSQICKYNFNNPNQKQEFFKIVLKIGRELNQNFHKIYN